MQKGENTQPPWQEMEKGEYSDRENNSKNLKSMSDSQQYTLDLWTLLYFNR